MRIFSEKEKEIIKLHLLDGATIDQMLPFSANNIRIEITINRQRQLNRYIKYGESNNVKVGEELSDLADLLDYLLKSELIKEVQSDSTSMHDFLIHSTFYYGESRSNKQQIFNLSDPEQVITNFHFRYHVSKFKATEALKAMVKNKFKTKENINDSSFSFNILNLILTGVIGFGTLGFAVYTNKQGNEIDSLKKKLIIKTKRIEKDSLQHQQDQDKINRQGIQIDTMNYEIRKLIKGQKLKGRVLIVPHDFADSLN